MKKVVMLGDSLRMSYWKRTAELLADICEVYGPEEICAYAMHTLRRVRGWFREWGLDRADLIHWNNGVWDHHRSAEDGEPLSSPEMYLSLCGRLSDELLRHTDRLVFASTSPAGAGYEYRPDWLTGLPLDGWNREVAEYNALAAALLVRRGVKINDIHGLLTAHPEFIGPDGIHLSEAGVEAVARQTAACIRRELSE